MPRRNLIPFLLLAALGVGGLAFAVLGASSAPSGATLTVQNGSARTFGTPTGSTSFAFDLVDTISTSAGPSGWTGSKGTIRQVRQVDYKPPSRMTMYQETASGSKLIAVLSPSAAACRLSSYTAIVGGSPPWTPSGTAFVRTETLAAFEGRVPAAAARTCASRPSNVPGTVEERAVVRGDYLVGIRLTVDVPQSLANGRHAASEVENQSLVLLQINGTPTSALRP